MPEQLLRGLAGGAALLTIALLCSRDRRLIQWKPVLSGIGFNMLFALLILRTSGGRAAFEGISAVLLKILQFSGEGTRFVFGPLFDGFSRIPGYSSSSFVFVLGALVPIIFFGALINMLYYLGIMQRIVRSMAWGLRRLFGLGGPEATAAASNIFVGQVQGAMTVAPYIAGMTEAQLFQVMVVGMSTVGAGMPLVYAGMGARMDYVLAANIMAVPAAVVFAKILLPERQTVPDEETLKLSEYRAGVNLLDALGRGAMDGWKVVLAISVMLLAFIPMVHLLNWAIVSVSHNASDLETILGWLFTPAAFIVGVPTADSAAFARLVGTKTAFNEVIAFGGLTAAGLSPRGFMLTCFALTGFANFTSIAIQIGGLGELAPTRKGDVARLGLRCVLAATLANLLNAAIAGILFVG
ncbi:MAG: NupC/NupG family nucleoside CNT transporter [Steroidobacteraceae bacterium]|nr:NupC/NupG family nucleoside CNT transporter [Deltaproteobacteria bacterium]